MLLLLIGLYFLALVFLMKLNARLAVGLFVLSLPTYLIRFNIGPLPATVLELGFGAISLGWLLFYARTGWPVLTNFLKEHRWFALAMVIFLLSSLGSIWVSDMAVASLGQWRAYFLEPMVLFVILIGLSGRQTPPNLPVGRGGSEHPPRPPQGGICANDLVWFLALSTVSISVYAIVQQFTGWGIATEQWTNPATRRVTAFFSSPNAVALYLGPIIMLMWAFIWKKTISEGRKKLEIRNWKLGLIAIITLLALVAVLFTRSQGGFAGLAIGATLFAYLVGYKKSALAVVAAGIVLLGAVVLWPRALPLHYQSGGNRLWLWSHSIDYLTQSPRHFVLGTGIRQFFRKIQKPFYNPKQMERIIYPHNIFLNFWTETGLFGMLSFGFIFGYISLIAYRIYRQSDRVIGAGLLAALAVILAHGLLDVPYFKNDLAMEWWILVVIICFPWVNKYNSQFVSFQSINTISKQFPMS